jgi:hypothetical protein
MSNQIEIRSKGNGDIYLYEPMKLDIKKALENAINPFSKKKIKNNK